MISNHLFVLFNNRTENIEITFECLGYSSITIKVDQKELTRIIKFAKSVGMEIKE